MQARLVLAIVLAGALGMAHAGCPDGDYDGVCDEVDTCTHDGVLRLSEASLRITGADAPVDDERVRLRGRIVVDGDVGDPAEEGMRIVLERLDLANGDRQALLSAVIPGGDGWRGRDDGAAWTYRDARGRHGGVTRISVRRRLSLPVIPPDVLVDARTTYDVQVLARHGSFLVDADLVDGFLPDSIVLDVGVGFGPVGTDGSRCASRIFPNQHPQTPCSVSGNGGVVVCATAAPVGPCRLGEPRDVVMCETMAVMWLQERHRAQLGEYWMPPDHECDGLPGYVPTTDTSCAMTVVGDGFIVHVESPHELAYGCTFDPSAPAGQRLYCSYS
jgi:hypothetical protein